MDRACRGQLLCDAVDSCAQRIRASTAARAVSRIALSPLALSAHRTRSGVGGDPLAAHQTREVLAPFTQHGLVDMEAPSIGAFRFHDQVHVRVFLVVKAEGADGRRSEEHTPELQYQSNTVSRLLLQQY